jgi:hypothetical protein
MLDHLNTSKVIHKLEHVSPPERTTDIFSMRHLVNIVSRPKEMNPRNVSMIIKLVQMFNQQSSILLLKINHP